MKQILLFATVAASMLLCACSPNHGRVAIDPACITLSPLSPTVAQVRLNDLAVTPAPAIVVTDDQGKILCSQLTADSLLLFLVSDTDAAAHRYYAKADSLPFPYEARVKGRVYPERKDDIAWENEASAFRLYGPATEASGERAFGYDLFLKYPDQGLVVEALYAPETDPATWAKVDSLRKISDALADEFIESFSYHVDHGKGMDSFPCGATLGAGVAAPLVGDTLAFAGCYRTATLLDNGPLRFTLRLDFAPRNVGAMSDVVEHRTITLDAGSPANLTRVWFDNLSDSITLGAGFPLRDDAPYTRLCDSLGAAITYSHPLQRQEYGRALVGLAMPDADATAIAAGHLLALTAIAPSDTLTYCWGYRWIKDTTAIEPEARAWAQAVAAQIGLLK